MTVTHLLTGGRLVVLHGGEGSRFGARIENYSFLLLLVGREQIVLQYEPNTEEIVFRTKLRESREKDKKFRQTTAGPHRDDFKVIVSGIDLRHYGSQGQQRSAALSLKLAEITLIEQQIHEKPILLLDDVLSELDSRRQSDLLKTIGSVQTFLTCTGMDDLRERNFPIDRVFHVEAGHVENAE